MSCADPAAEPTRESHHRLAPRPWSKPGPASSSSEPTANLA